MPLLGLADEIPKLIFWRIPHSVPIYYRHDQHRPGAACFLSARPQRGCLRGTRSQAPRLVYSAALRSLNSHHLAEEVAQVAFAELARQASRLRPDTVLAAWLYQVTR